MPTARSSLSLCTSMLLLSMACGDDADCEWTLREWCAEFGGCKAYATRDEAFAALPTDELSILGAQSCAEGSVLRVGGGLGGRVYTYDAESGELVGVLSYSDAIHEGCDRANSSAGDAVHCFGGCALLGDSADGVCTGELAEPFIAACMDTPSQHVVGCEACACPACYPVVLQCSRLEQAPDGGLGVCDESGLIECLEEACPDACADQLAALGDR